MTKLTPTQEIIIASLKEGSIINHFRGIGTRYPASACLEDKDGKWITTVNLSTYRALRGKGLLRQIDRTLTHSTFTIIKELNL